MLGKKIFSSSNIFLIILQYFSSNFTFFIVISWLPFYLKSHWPDNPYAIYFSAIPLLFAAFSNWISGTITSILWQKGLKLLALKIPALIGFSLGIVGLVMASLNTNFYWFIICFSVAIFGVDMTLSPSWTYCNYLGKQYSGTLSGTMNMFGQLGSATSAILFSFFNHFFLLAATINALGMISWCLVKDES